MSRRALTALPSLAGAALIGWLLVRHRSELGATVSAASLPWLFASLASMAAGMLVLAWGWADTIDLLSAQRAPRRRVMAGYFAGELGKYLPGGVFSVIGRAEVARRQGLARPTAYASVVLSLLLAYAAAGAVAGTLAAVAVASGTAPALTTIAPLALPLALVALHPRLLGRALSLLQRLSGRGAGIEVPAWGRSLAVTLRYVPAWVLIGASTWAAARALLPHPSMVRIPLAAVLSWAAGFVAGPAPAGAGVREATFIAASGLPAVDGAAVALAARAASVLVDAGGGAVALAWLKP